MENNKNTSKKYQNINELFYELLKSLESCEFDFCAYVVREAYRFYMADLEKRLDKKVN